MMKEKVILIDENDKEIGEEEKIKAHQEGKLHRAFSIFIFNSQGKMLLQKRAQDKYHSGGLWSNACDGHPRPGEDIEKAAHRRLKEEMGFDCKLKKIFKFKYKAELENGLVEHEIDHVFWGTYNENPKPNPKEIETFKWVDLKSLLKDVSSHSEKYAFWFKAALPKVVEFYQKNFKT